MNKKTKEFREKIAQDFIASIQEKPLQWKEDWTLADSPINAVTGRAYHGLNRFWLAHLTNEREEYTDRRWATFKQIQDNGWHLKKGSAGVQVEYWWPYDQESKKGMSWKDYRAISPDERQHCTLRCTLFHVFNGAQIEGLPELAKEKGNDISPAEAIGKIVSGMGVGFCHDGAGRAYYSVNTDTVHLPKVSAFKSDYGYNSTALHELSHATGSTSRLNRDLTGCFGSEKYAFEELVAEMSSCFMSVDLPEEMDPMHYENHKAYFQSWATEIAKDPEILFRAIKDAERAANFLEAQIMPEKALDLQKAEERAVTVDEKLTEQSEEVQMAAPEVTYQNRRVTEYIADWLKEYDYARPICMCGSELPSHIMEADLARGGMEETEEECRAWIAADPMGAERTKAYIAERYPELSDLTPDTDARRYSLLMMEQEIYSAVKGSYFVAQNWNDNFVFDKCAAESIADAAGVPFSGRVAENRISYEAEME